MIIIPKNKSRLFCPGPVHVAKNVRRAAALRSNEIGHREPEFEVLFRSVTSKLLELFGQKDDTAYQAVILTGSGTAANESILSSIVPKGERILVVSNGEFGTRLATISQYHNENTKHLCFEWAEKIDLKKLEAEIQSEKPYCLAVVHHETSTGMLNPITAIGNLCKRYGIVYLVDTVSSSGAEIIDVKKSNISFCSGSSSKAIGSLPGLSFVVGSRVEFEKLSDIPPRSSYLHLYNFYLCARTSSQTPNTPAVQLFFSLEKALENILAEGMDVHHTVLQERARYMRSKLKELGFSFLINEADMSCVLTTVLSLTEFHPSVMREKMRKKNIIIYSGKGPLQHSAFQIATIGEVSHSDLDFLVANLKKTLQKPTEAYGSDYLPSQSV
jgi:2-aminoethylphosphonate-pyruvate transaminase